MGIGTINGYGMQDIQEELKVYIFESKIQKWRKQAILGRLRRGLVCL